MAWRSGLPRNPALATQRDLELSLIGDDLIHEALGSPKGKNGIGRGKAGLGDDDMGKSDYAFWARCAPLDHPDFGELTTTHVSTVSMVVSELLGVISDSGLTEREVGVVVRCNSGGESRSHIAHDLGAPIAAVDAAYERGMAALASSAALSPFFGLRDAYREDLRRTRHRRVSHNRKRTNR